MGRKVEGIKSMLGIVTGKDVPGGTVGEVLDNFALYYVTVPVTFVIKDGSGAVLSGASVTLREGDVVGSGEVVTANGNGSYSLTMGVYNYYIVKTSYTSKTGTFIVVASDIKAKSKQVEIELLVA
jgi:hypothetical protein